MSSSPDSKVCRLTVLCSGNGSNLQALIDACETGKIPRSKIIKVIVNRKNAYATTRAANAGIPTQYFNLVSGGFQQKGEKDEAKLKDARARYDAALADVILQDKPDLVVLAGWMHVFSQPFLTPLDAANVQAINLHPALPGEHRNSNPDVGSKHTNMSTQANMTAPMPLAGPTKISRMESWRTAGRAS
jgi:phosphoribosylglycinamide formyltransferase